MRRAFSLIELLVTVAIIAVLIALVVPGLGHARELGRRAACGSNLRQWGVAVSAYASEQRELPRGTDAALMSDYRAEVTRLVGTVPLRCPTDRESWPAWGSSYSHPFLFDQARRRLVKYEANPDWYIGADAGWWHGTARNVVWLDGHVEFTGRDVWVEVDSGLSGGW